MKTYRLSQAARSDIIDILAWTHATFGGNSRKRYEKLLATALRDIAQNPSRAGTSLRPEIADEVRTYHLRHSRERARSENGLVKNPRHLLLYRVLNDDLVGVGRVLHDSMEIERHLPDDFGEISA